MDEDQFVQDLMARTEKSATSQAVKKRVENVEWADIPDGAGQELFALEEIFNALGNRQRLEIVHELMQYAKTPSEVAFLLELPRTTVSYQIRVLEEAGVVQALR